MREMIVCLKGSAYIFIGGALRECKIKSAEYSALEDRIHYTVEYDGSTTRVREDEIFATIDDYKNNRHKITSSVPTYSTRCLSQIARAGINHRVRDNKMEFYTYVFDEEGGAVEKTVIIGSFVIRFEDDKVTCDVITNINKKKHLTHRHCLDCNEYDVKKEDGTTEHIVGKNIKFAIKEEQQKYIDALQKAIKDLEEHNMRIIKDNDNWSWGVVNIANIKSPRIECESDTENMENDDFVCIDDVMQNIDIDIIEADGDYRYLMEC